MIPYPKPKKSDWIRNLIVAHAVFSLMPERSIYPSLKSWCKDRHECGSPACFGGWVARMDYFIQQGIRKVDMGYPVVFSGDWDTDTTPASMWLFGNRKIFDARTDLENRMRVDGKRISDLQVILLRIEIQMGVLLKQPLTAKFVTTYEN